MTVAFDEMTGVDGTSRAPYGELSRWLGEIPSDVLDYRRREAELLFRRIGITFSVYGEADAQERLIPFDVLPPNGTCCAWGSSNASKPSICTSRTSTGAARFSRPATSRKTWCSRIRCSGRR
jgi:hypothetical protein